MSRTASTRQGENAVVNARGVPAGHRVHVNVRARSHRCGWRCVLTEDPRNEHLVRVAAGDTDQDSKLRVLWGPSKRTDSAGMEASG